MHFIQRLKQDVANRDTTLARAGADIDLFIAHLHSPKFAGVDSQGERLDWIATADVLNRLIEMRSNLVVDKAGVSQ